MCIAQDSRRRETSKPHGYSQFTKSLPGTSLKAVRRENSVDTEATESSHASESADHHENNDASVDGRRHEKKYGTAASLESTLSVQQVTERCTTPPATKYDLRVPPSNPNPLREVLKIDWDTASHLFLPFL